MNRSLQEYLRCVIYGNDTKYNEWSRDVILFPLAYNSEITTTLGLSPYEMDLNQKPRKIIMFTANSQKTQCYCQPTKESICYYLLSHTHDEDHFHQPQILKLASGTHTECTLNRDLKKWNLPNKSQKTITKTECSIPNTFTIYTSYKPKNWNVCLDPKFCNTKGNIQKFTTNPKRTISSHRQTHW